MPRGDISSEAQRRGESSTYQLHHGNIFKSIFTLGLSTSFCLPVIQDAFTSFPKTAYLKRRTHVSIQNNKEGLREMAPISIPRGSSIPHTKYTDQITVVLHQDLDASLCLLVLLNASWPFKFKSVSLQINC